MKKESNKPINHESVVNHILAERKLEQKHKEEKERIKVSVGENIRLALEQNKKPIQRLGQGVHNGYFYYGTTLLIRGNPVSAVIASDGKGDKKIYLGINEYTYACSSCHKEIIASHTDKSKIKNPAYCDKCKRKDFRLVDRRHGIRTDFGLDYRTDFNDDTIDYQWQTDSIKAWYNGYYEPRTIKEIFLDIEGTNIEFIDHHKTEYHTFTACWIIATYCFSLFEQFGRIYFRADKASGKTKQTRLIKFQAFNPMWITKGTESSIFRDAEATCGTLIVDNMDKLNPDLKQAIEHNIETGWMYDATYRLTNKNTWKTEKYAAYSAMCINNIYGLDDNTVDKTFEIPMLKSVNAEIKKCKPRAKDKRWEKVRDDLRYWVLDNWHEIQEAYNKISTDMSDREYDVAEGVLCIARLVSEDVFNQLMCLIEDKIEENEAVDVENNKEYLVFGEVWKKFVDNDRLVETNVFFSDIAEILFPLFNPTLEKGTSEYDNRRKSFSRYIGKIIRSVPMFKKTSLSNGRTYVKIKRKDLEQIMRLKKFLNDSGTLLTSTNTITSTISTISTPKVEEVEISEKVEEVFDVEKYIKKHDKGEGVSKNELISAYDNPFDLHAWILGLLSKGKIMEVKPEVYKIVE